MAIGLSGCATEALTPQELTLKQNLGVLRQVLQQFKVDNQKFPKSLESLVEAGYLRALPLDTVTKSRDTWLEVREPGEGIVGVRSGARGVASDGTRYFDW
jgi:general secretion pathway protein G